MPHDPEIDAAHMRRAIRLAMNGRGRVEPNPMVGCVIVNRAGQVIGEGFHEQYGQPHAEPNALASCTESPAGATAYVTLEPCCHTNKQTPPCAPRLIEAKLARAVIGCADPNTAVNGKGAAMLRAAGIKVDASPLEAECRQLIAPFVAGVVHHRPYVTLKWAQTADGKVAGPGGARLQISNAGSGALVQHLRARCEAIAVGIGTILADDPLLIPRAIPADRSSQTLRIILDTHLRIDPTRQILTEPGGPPVLVYHAATGLADRIRFLVNAGVNLRAITANSAGRLSLPHLLADLRDEPTTHLLVEPGPTLAHGFFHDNLSDRLWVFRSPTSVNDPSSPPAAAIPPDFVMTAQLDLDGDTLTEYLNPRSPAFFADAPSADLVLAAEHARR